MTFDEFIKKTDEIAEQAAEADEETKKKLTDDFFDAAIEFFDEHCAGPYQLADGEIGYIRPVRPAL